MVDQSQQVGACDIESNNFECFITVSLKDHENQVQV